MKIIKSRVFITAVVILGLGAAVFFTSTQIAMGAEENAIISQQSTYAAAAEAADAKAKVPDPSAETAEPDVESTLESAAPSATGKPEFITEEEAISATLWVAENVFDLSVDKSTLEAVFEAAHDLTDEKGVVYSSIHDNWKVENSDYFCYLDAITGDVLMFDVQTRDYPGESITQGGFDREFAENIYDDPDNIYVKAARSIVEAKLAGGRSIRDIMVDGIQFVWDKDTQNTGSDPDATGTVLVDCHVYVESGSSYTLSFMGTSEVILKIFRSHPTHHACTWGYFYEEQGADYPDESATGEWYTAPGITPGPAPSETPPPTSVPSQR